MTAVTLTVDRAPDHLDVNWSDGRRRGTCRFDRIEGTVPEWLGAADELLDGADRRTADRVVAAVAAWAADAGLVLGIWEDGGDVELLR